MKLKELKELKDNGPATEGRTPGVVPSSGEEGCGVVAEQTMLDL